MLLYLIFVVVNVLSQTQTWLVGCIMNETDLIQPLAMSLSPNYDGNPNGFPNVILHYPKKIANTQVMWLILSEYCLKLLCTLLLKLSTDFILYFTHSPNLSSRT